MITLAEPPENTDNPSRSRRWRSAVECLRRCQPVLEGPFVRYSGCGVQLSCPVLCNRRKLRHDLHALRVCLKFSCAILAGLDNEPQTVRQQILELMWQKEWRDLCWGIGERVSVVASELMGLPSFRPSHGQLRRLRINRSMLYRSIEAMRVSWEFSVRSSWDWTEIETSGRAGAGRLTHRPHVRRRAQPPRKEPVFSFGLDGRRGFDGDWGGEKRGQKVVPQLKTGAPQRLDATECNTLQQNSASVGAENGTGGGALANGCLEPEAGQLRGAQMRGTKRTDSTDYFTLTASGPQAEFAILENERRVPYRTEPAGRADG